MECPCLEVCIPAIQPGTLPYRGERSAPVIFPETWWKERRSWINRRVLFQSAPATSVWRTLRASPPVFPRFFQPPQSCPNKPQRGPGDVPAGREVLNYPPTQPSAAAGWGASSLERSSSNQQIPCRWNHHQQRCGLMQVGPSGGGVGGPTSCSCRKGSFKLRTLSAGVSFWEIGVLGVNLQFWCCFLVWSCIFCWTFYCHDHNAVCILY